jgi:hypothetical protein
MAEEAHPTAPDEDPAAAEGKQEAGAREQGVASEDSEDLSSPQLTEPDRPSERPGQPRAGQNG